MSLAKRIIPAILKRGASQVKGRAFDSWRSVGAAMQACKIMAARGADEIVLLDIDATPSGKGPDFNAIRELASDFLTPLAVGGGVRTMEDAKALFEAGADKIVVRTAYGLIPEIATRYGSQAVVASMDVRDGFVIVAREGHPSAMAGVERWAKWMAQLGAGEILLTSMDREGSMEGYDLGLINRIGSVVDIPVIAHGGCGSPEHMLQAFEAGADACAAGAMFLFTDHTPKSCALYLKDKGLNVRIP